MIPVIIPMKSGHFLSKEVIKSLHDQTVKLCVVPVTNNSGDGNIAQAINRNIGRDIVKSFKGDFVYMQDCDVILLKNNILELAIKEMEKNKNIGAIYFNVCKNATKIISEHMHIASVLFRNKALQTITFYSDNPNVCNCYELVNQLRKNNFEYHFLYSESVGTMCNTYHF